MEAIEPLVFAVELFGLPVPFVLLVPMLNHLLTTTLSIAFGYVVLVTTFVLVAVRMIKSTARFAKNEGDGILLYMMTPLLFVAFPQWMLFLVMILKSVNLDSSDSATSMLSIVAICVALLVIVRTIKTARRDTVEAIKKQEESEEQAQTLLSMTRKVHSKQFHGVTSCLKLL